LKSLTDKNEEIPQWLVDASKQAEKKKKNLNKKKKKSLTNDWRFWEDLDEQ
jgi:hypothetical protein